jgi:hypothetical protein
LASALLLVTLISIALALVACGSSVEQSAGPSRTPVQASPNPNLVEFEGHLADAKTAQGAIVRALASASVGSQAELLASARQLAEWAADEADWLADHPADACYVAAADAYRSGVAAIAESAAGFELLATASGTPSDAEGQDAGQGLSTGTDAIEHAAALARTARAGCR